MKLSAARQTWLVLKRPVTRTTSDLIADYSIVNFFVRLVKGKKQWGGRFRHFFWKSATIEIWRSQFADKQK